MDSDLLLIVVIGAALAFDFTNGFHDTANAVGDVRHLVGTSQTTYANRVVPGCAGQRFISAGATVTCVDGRRWITP